MCCILLVSPGTMCVLYMTPSARWHPHRPETEQLLSYCLWGVHLADFTDLVQM